MLDINILLNNSAIINLEMQVVNEHNWQDRSLSYLCRSFHQLYQGEDCSSAKPAIHVGFLNFQPFPDYPEFHASYKLKNEKLSDENEKLSDELKKLQVRIKELESLSIK